MVIPGIEHSVIEPFLADLIGHEGRGRVRVPCQETWPVQRLSN
jgi:hypothetical protein